MNKLNKKIKILMITENIIKKILKVKIMMNFLFSKKHWINYINMMSKLNY